MSALAFRKLVSTCGKEVIVLSIVHTDGYDMYLHRRIYT